jgi:C2 domain
MGGLFSTGGSDNAQYLTTVGIRQVNGLAESAKNSLPDPFVLIECEGKKAKTPVIPNCRDAVFNETALFYRKSLDSPIKVQVILFKVRLLFPIFDGVFFFSFFKKNFFIIHF